MRYLVSAMLVVAGLIHLLPVPGVLGSDQLATLYGLPFSEPNLAMLMRHRAVLFGLLGLFLICAAFMPAFQTVAFIAGSISVTSFVWLAWPVGSYNAQIGRIFAADIVALICLVVGIIAHVYVQGGSKPFVSTD